MNLALLGYVVAGQFVTVAYYPYTWIHLMFVTAIGTFWENEKATGTGPFRLLRENLRAGSLWS